MIVSQLVTATLTMGLEHLVEARYGGLGMLSLFLVGTGIKARNSTCSGIGAVLFLLLMLQS